MPGPVVEFVGSTKPWTCNYCGLVWNVGQLAPCNHTDAEWAAWGTANGKPTGAIPRWTPTAFPPVPTAAEILKQAEADFSATKTAKVDAPPTAPALDAHKDAPGAKDESKRVALKAENFVLEPLELMQPPPTPTPKTASKKR